jgi:hypothetical protein
MRDAAEILAETTQILAEMINPTESNELLTESASQHMKNHPRIRIRHGYVNSVTNLSKSKS